VHSAQCGRETFYTADREEPGYCLACKVALTQGERDQIKHEQDKLKLGKLERCLDGELV
jgi:hypothetical protein